MSNLEGEKSQAVDESPAISGGGSPDARRDGSPDENVPYTVFTRGQKALITIMMGVAMFFSPMTANIFFPIVPALQKATRASLQRINLTITAYIIMQGISPLFVGDLADKVGRRPVYILTFIIFTVASLGLALNRDSYSVLLILRVIQSAGCSATAAISYGVLSDVAMPAERGRMLGAAMVAANAGPSIGPLLGGILADRAGWRWVFWFLVVLGTTFLLTLVMLFPETARAIVGNGSIPVRRWKRPVLSFLFEDHEARNHLCTLMNQGKSSTFRVPSPFPALRIIFYKDAALVLWISAVHYLVYYSVQATMPSMFASIYNLSELQIGLSYLSIGIGVAAGGYSNGKFLDINYSRTAKQIGFIINRISGDDLCTFPVERARTRFAPGLILLCSITLMGYGWTFQERTHLAVPLILQFILGFLTTCTVQTFNTLLVDIFPKSPSTASASGNITRCALSAGGVAAMQPLFNSLSYGWVFTIVGAISGMSAIAALLLIKSNGMKWRNQRGA